VAPMSVLGGGKLLGEILRRRGAVGEADLGRALELQKSQGGALGTILVQMGLITKEQLMEALGEQFGMEVVDLSTLEVNKAAAERVERSVAVTYKVMPIRWDGTTLTVAMANPLNVATLDDLRTLLNCEVQGAVSNEKDIQEAHEKYYRQEEESIEKLMQQFGQAEGASGVDLATETIDLESAEEMAESAPVRRLVNYIILTAVRERPPCADWSTTSSSPPCGSGPVTSTSSPTRTTTASVSVSTVSSMRWSPHPSTWPTPSPAGSRS